METSRDDVASSDERAQMISSQLVRRGIRDPRVLQAMFDTPREAFIAPTLRGAAYNDSPQSIPCGQTISQPYIVARMLELLAIAPHDRVLEIGSGTGYQAALLSRLARQVTTIERHPQLADEARRNIMLLGITHCEVRCADGTVGAADRAPFDAIVVAASAPSVPPSLVEQLAPGGRLVCPVGQRREQRLVRVTRALDGRSECTEEFEPVIFVPLIGREGWQSERDEQR